MSLRICFFSKSPEGAVFGNLDQALPLSAVGNCKCLIGGVGKQPGKIPGVEVDRVQTRAQVRGVHVIHVVSESETGAYQVSDVDQVRQIWVQAGFVRLVVMKYRFA